MAPNPDSFESRLAALLERWEAFAAQGPGKGIDPFLDEHCPDAPDLAARFRELVAAAAGMERFDLREVPTLTKTEMMRNFDRVMTDPRLRLAELEDFVREPARLGQWYLNEFAPSRTSGTQGLKAMIVQNRRMMELLFALQMVRGTVYRSNATGIMTRVVHTPELHKRRNCVPVMRSR